MNSILPPREFTREGTLKVMYVSPEPASKTDVIMLKNKLDELRVKKGAKDTGICATREMLWSQCFDELIRQITIDCAERGFLLVRVRDEFKMLTQAYQSRYESSMAYGMRKALVAEQRKLEMQTTI